ncbi:hypothetical protein ISI07_01350 [Burkholderia pseudomallei]|nr:hypothetical protein [Burkholderia pseudomallei]MCE2033358.1 hypothetical protein [Burkholderia pseudomallei CS]MCE2039583.1 hypothetical protein [Burkholderia pseudomallei CB]MCE2045507.1 hypothetical protein [Burkholderia pseudomallei OS]MCE2051534.1 hypothetical protein [Burkholderia pseudomallei OB]
MKLDIDSSIYPMHQFQLVRALHQKARVNLSNSDSLSATESPRVEGASDMDGGWGRIRRLSHDIRRAGKFGMRIGMSESAAPTSRDLAPARCAAVCLPGNRAMLRAATVGPRVAAATTLSNSPARRMSFYIWN